MLSGKNRSYPHTQRRLKPGVRGTSSSIIAYPLLAVVGIIVAAAAVVVDFVCETKKFKLDVKIFRSTTVPNLHGVAHTLFDAYERIARIIK